MIGGRKGCGDVMTIERDKEGDADFDLIADAVYRAGSYASSKSELMFCVSRVKPKIHAWQPVAAPR